MANQTDMQALQDFAEDSRVADLKKALSKFNIFEALGATHKELWHSDFLAFLLNPLQNHVIGDEFTRLLLKHALPDLPERDTWEGISVSREHLHIDILIEDEQSKTCIIIENKVWSQEGPRQLETYWEAMEAERPGWRIYGIFLTRTAQAPSDPRYHPLSYETVKALLGKVLDMKSSQMDADAVLCQGRPRIWFLPVLGESMSGLTEALW